MRAIICHFTLLCLIMLVDTSTVMLMSGKALESTVFIPCVLGTLLHWQCRPSRPIDVTKCHFHTSPPHMCGCPAFRLELCPSVDIQLDSIPLCFPKCVNFQEVKYGTATIPSSGDIWSVFLTNFLFRGCHSSVISPIFSILFCLIV